MNKSLKTKSALLLLAFACAPCAPAQEPAAKPAEAVRERRATEPQKPAQPTATNTKSAEPSSNEKAAAETAEASTSAETQGPSADDASQSPAERARQRQTMAEQLAASGNKAEAVALLRSMLAE